MNQNIKDMVRELFVKNQEKVLLIKSINKVNVKKDFLNNLTMDKIINPIYKKHEFIYIDSFYLYKIIKSYYIFFIYLIFILK